MKKFLILYFFTVFLIISCQNQSTHDWPQDVKSKLWVPNVAKDLQYYRLAESYQVQYKIDECYPGRSFIKSIVDNMGQKGLQRLNYDFLNPKIKANHAKFAGGIWDTYINENGNHVAQWIDDWQDNNKNHIRYGLKYGDKKNISEKSCDLEVVVIFLPADAVKR